MTSEEAARRLGVKLPTIYAYVSRGLLVSHRSADDRRSLFDVSDVEALARRSRPHQRPEGRLATVATAITELRSDGPLYRGVLATALVGSKSFEEVADLLWQVGPGPWTPANVGPVPVTTLDDRLRWAVVMCGSVDPLRSDQREIAVAQAGRTIIATMIASLGDPPDVELATELPIADRLAALLVRSADRATAAAVGAALVLLADHELASSTLAVRIAASTRADVYDAVLAGLGVVNGPLHGGASRQAHLLLVDAQRRGSAIALDDALRWHRSAPGFGHFFYEDGDPRFDALLPLIDRVAPAAQREVIESVMALAADRGLPRPNIDFGGAALSFASGMEAEAGSVLFKISRVAGWVAHYLEELKEPPLRYRARAVFVTAR